MQPVVSVIIPFFNNEDISGRCLKSVLDQTFCDLEIICVCEDFGNDIARALQESANEDPRIRVIERKTEEPYNTGLSEAVGEYVLLLTPDDYCEPNMLEHAVRVVQNNCADFVVFRAEVCTDGKVKTTTIREEDLPPYMPFSRRAITGDISTAFSSLLQDRLYSREFLCLNGLKFDENGSCHGRDFVKKAFQASHRIAYLADVLVHINGEAEECSEEAAEECSAEALPLELSVVIPVHNSEKYIRECLDSVLENRNIGLEVICVDDCSTDSTPEILRDYAERYANVTVLKNDTNLYAGASRNKGLLAARGKYVHFLDADDIVISGAYRKLYDIAEKNDLDWIKTTVRAFRDEDGKKVFNFRYDMSRFDHWYDGRLLDFKSAPNKFLTYMSLVPWNAIYKRSFLTDNDIHFNHLFCVNDRSFFVETCVKGNRMMIARIDIVRHRLNVGNSLVAKRIEHFDCQFESYKIMKRICDENQVSDRVRFRILDAEMYDMINWYLQIPEDDELKKKCWQELHDFAAENVDPDLFEKRRKDSLWMRYRELTKTGEIKKMCKVSVIVPIFGEANHIGECLQSLRCQSLRDMEIICVFSEKDHARVLRMIDQYRKADNRIKIVEIPDINGGRALNAGIENSMGEYTGIMFPDDHAAIDLYEMYYQTAKENAADFVRADFYRVCNEEEPDSIRQSYCALSEDPEEYNIVFNPQENKNVWFYPSDVGCGIYRTDLLREFDIRFREAPGSAVRDEGFFFQINAFSKRAMILDVAGYYRRRGDIEYVLDNPQKVYAVDIEYDFIRDVLMDSSDAGAWDTVKRIYWLKRSVDKLAPFDAIAPEYKKEYCRNMSRELNDAEKEGLIGNEDFDEKYRPQMLMILKDPETFAAQSMGLDEIPKAAKVDYAAINKLKRDSKRLQDIMESNSYKLGFTLTSLPRRVKETLKNLK